ncbi:MAG TPA: hypothetical protein VKO18_21195 [Terriglobia bacterium]|nr:hypothetical protein [Terriglobia bacterium]
MKNLSLVLFVILLSAIAGFAKPKQRTFNASPDELFKVALKVARLQHVITYVDKSERLFSFSTGRAGLDCTAGVEPEGPDKSTLTINMKRTQDASIFNGSDKIAKKLFDAVEDELKKEK